MPSRPTAAPPSHHTGVLLLLVCAFLWSLNGPLIKLLSNAHHQQTGLAIAFWRSLFAGLILLGPATRRRSGLPHTMWWLPALLAFAAMCLLFVTATTYTEAASAIILQYTAPFWIFVLSAVLLREPPPRHQWFALPVAMLGVLIIFLGGYSQAGLGLILALASGVAFAFVMLSFRRLRDADPVVTPCLTNTATALLLAPWALLTLPLPGHLSTWLLLILMGIVQMALPYWLLARALRSVPPAEASLITLCEPLMNTTWTWLTVGEVPRTTTLVGGAIILVALIFKTYLDRIYQPVLSAPPR